MKDYNIAVLLQPSTLVKCTKLCHWRY